MKGAYVARLDLQAGHTHGVRKKIDAQLDVFRDAGHEVSLYCLADSDVVRDGTVLRRGGHDPGARTLTSLVHFYRTVGAAIGCVDFVYLRFQRASLGLVAFLARLRREHPGVRILLEIPTFPYYQEYRSARERVLGAGDWLMRRAMARRVDRIITFSRRERILGVPTIVTDNGVGVDGVPVREAPPLGSELRLVGVANLSFWHGYDRVIEGMAKEGQGAGAVVFDVVGDGEARPALEALATARGVDDRVNFHGPLHGEDLHAVVSQAHVGISSIGRHRVNAETSDLKSREFCAAGLPFVFAYDDADFRDVPFALRVPGADDALDLDAVRAFRGWLHAHPGHELEMRRFAEARLDWKAKLRGVLDYVEGRGAGS